MKINYDRVINLHLISTAINVNTHALQIKCALFFFSLWLWYLLFLANSLSTNWDTDYSNQTIISLGLTWFKFCDTFFKCLCKTGANRVCLIDVSNVRGSHDFVLQKGESHSTAPRMQMALSIFVPALITVFTAYCYLPVYPWALNLAGVETKTGMQCTLMVKE